MTCSAWFQCIAGCDERWPLTDIRYRCPRCGDLLEVAHDLAARRDAGTGDDWRALFDQRWRGRTFPDVAGVWAKREVVAPHVRPEHIVTAGEGASALLPVPGYASALELAENDGVYLANSMNSLRLEGQKTVAMEIVQQLGWAIPDWVVIPGGNLGNVSALEPIAVAARYDDVRVALDRGLDNAR